MCRAERRGRLGLGAHSLHWPTLPPWSLQVSVHSPGGGEGGDGGEGDGGDKGGFAGGGGEGGGEGGAGGEGGGGEGGGGDGGETKQLHAQWPSAQLSAPFVGPSVLK